LRGTAGFVVAAGPDAEAAVRVDCVLDVDRALAALDTSDVCAAEEVDAERAFVGGLWSEGGAIRPGAVAAVREGGRASVADAVAEDASVMDHRSVNETGAQGKTHDRHSQIEFVLAQLVLRV
jgi:hypothetical protein